MTTYVVSFEYEVTVDAKDAGFSPSEVEQALERMVVAEMDTHFGRTFVSKGGRMTPDFGVRLMRRQVGNVSLVDYETFDLSEETKDEDEDAIPVSPGQQSLALGE